MSISNFTELVAALDGATGYLHRSDLTAKIPDFIKIAESRINRKLRLSLQEVEVDLTATIGSRMMAVPALFDTPIALWLTTYLPRQEMIYLSPENLPVTTFNSSSDYYTVDGAFIATENPANLAYTYTLRYLTNFDLASTSTNAVLTNFPDIYIYGALMASVAYTLESTNLQLWQGLFDQAMKEAISNFVATRSKANLRTEFGGSRSSILRGY